ncbi:MAG: hypothetical protein ACLQDM_16550 [Bradyrhizobium sp.]
MKDQGGRPTPSRQPSKPGSSEGSRPVSNAALAIFLAALATALVLGYLFLNKLVDISQQEDCMLSRSRSCAAIELHPDR